MSTDKRNRADAPAPGDAGPSDNSHAVRPVCSGGDKIRDRHLERIAIVYVRQSRPQQVLEHRESRERQYALADRAVTLGWPRDRVVIIDEDQGHSGKSADHRGGFHRLLAEVTLDHVGLVLSLEMSRLARSNKDWHHLLEICAVFDTLLADQDGVYDAGDVNDRLLLGLKGTMSEFELVTMRNRLERGRMNKAQRGELFLSVPFGYVKLPSGEVVLDPDEQVRAVVRLIFDKFDELGTVYRVFRYLLRHNIQIGMRARTGPRRGQLEWRRPALATLVQMFRHPIYAGAYTFGRRLQDPKRLSSRTGRAVNSYVPLENCKVLKLDQLPAYISWERFVANRRRAEQNRSRPTTMGTARCGTALLSGLVVCGSCGRRLHTYHKHTDKPYYGCRRHFADGSEPHCPGMTASVLDGLLVEQVLRALEPAALEASLKAIKDIQLERERLTQHWRQRLERARYEVERAERQYMAVEPENRLVVRTLERQWEETLRRQQQIQEEYDRFERDQPPGLTEQERAKILALANDLPALWQAPQTTPMDRKEIIRCLVERVVADIRRDRETVGVTIFWRGGFTSQHQVVRPVRYYAQMEGYPQLIERLAQWRREGHTAVEMAQWLNEAGIRMPRMQPFSQDMIRKLLSRHGMAGGQNAADGPGPNEWWLADLSRRLEIPVRKLREWILRGWLRGRQTSAQKLWIAWADREEQKRLKKLQAYSVRGVVTYPTALTTPKKRN